jgi:hypothetical protein
MHRMVSGNAKAVPCAGATQFAPRLLKRGACAFSNEMTTATFSYNGPAVVHTGEFKQTVQLPNGNALNANGSFEATWVRAENGDWWIRRMVTRPNK